MQAGGNCLAADIQACHPKVCSGFVTTTCENKGLSIGPKIGIDLRADA
jgi:hypothetical protein